MNFKSFLHKSKVILFDGAMGTQLEKNGLELSGGINNLTKGEVVRRVHKEYIESGSQVLTTNTFTMNPIYMKTHGLNIDMKKVNQSGVNIALEAAAENVYVLGDLGPTGQMLQPYGTYSEEDFCNCFREQAQVLVQSGVHGFIIETMFDLQEALCALRACKDISSLPIIVSFTLSKKTNGGSTMMGNSLIDCARAVEKNKGDVIGVNCGDLDPQDIAEIIAGIKPVTNLPILVQPNAGKPKLVEGKTTYNMSPENFAQGIAQCIKAGASLVGGCCGTTPEHIQKVASLII